MTMDIPIQSAAMLYVVHVRCSGPVGARSSLYSLEAIAPDLIRSNSAWLFTARSLNSSMSLLPSVIASEAARFGLSALQHFSLLVRVGRPCSTANHSLRQVRLRTDLLLADRYQAD